MLITDKGLSREFTLEALSQPNVLVQKPGPGYFNTWCKIPLAAGTPNYLAIGEIVPEYDVAYPDDRVGISEFPATDRLRVASVGPSANTQPDGSTLKLSRYWSEVMDRYRELKATGRQFELGAYGECRPLWRILTYEELFPEKSEESPQGVGIGIPAKLMLQGADGPDISKVRLWVSSRGVDYPVGFYYGPMGSRKASGWKGFNGEPTTIMQTSTICTRNEVFSVHDLTYFDERWRQMELKRADEADIAACSNAVHDFFDDLLEVDRTVLKNVLGNYYHEFKHCDPYRAFKEVGEITNPRTLLSPPTPFEVGVETVFVSRPHSFEDVFQLYFAPWAYENGLTTKGIYPGTAREAGTKVMRTALVRILTNSLAYHNLLKDNAPFNCNEVYKSGGGWLADKWCRYNIVVSLIPLVGQIHDAMVYAGDIATGIEARTGEAMTPGKTVENGLWTSFGFLFLNVGQSISVSASLAKNSYKGIQSSYRGFRWAAAKLAETELTTMARGGLAAIGRDGKRIGELFFDLLSRAATPTAAMKLRHEVVARMRRDARQSGQLRFAARIALRRCRAGADVRRCR
jgi:hypothetical protein